MTTRVHIDSPTGTLTVEQDGATLAYVVEHARRLWDDLRAEPAPFGRGFGFTSHVAPQWDHDRQSGRMRQPVRAEGSP